MIRAGLGRKQRAFVRHSCCRLARALGCFNRMTVIYGTKERILDACQRVLAGTPKFFPPNPPTNKDLRGEPDWYGFEHTAWSIGEGIRLSLKANPKLKTDEEILNMIVHVIKAVNLRRGRQSFVMCLEFAGAAKHAADIAGFLSDHDIQGQVVNTLLKMKAKGFTGQVAPLLGSKQAWIRNYAKTYIERYP